MYTIESRVRYSEVDSERRLTLSALMDALQDCCAFQSEELGIGVDYLARNRCAWVVFSWQIEILRYPKMSDEIIIGTWPYEFKGFYGNRNFLITDKSGEVLVKANSVWVFMDLERMRPARIREEIAEKYKDVLEPQLPGEWAKRKIALPEGGEAKPPITITSFYIDVNHHVNNGKYVMLAAGCLPDDFEVGEIRVDYRKAAVQGDTLYPIVTVAEEQAWVNLANEAGEPYAVLQFFRKSN